MASHHKDCTVIDGRGRVCAADCAVGNPGKRAESVLSQVASDLGRVGGIGTVYEDAKAYGQPATVLVLPNGAAYRISVVELREPVSEQTPAAAPAVELPGA